MAGPGEWHPKGKEKKCGGNGHRCRGRALQAPRQAAQPPSGAAESPRRSRQAAGPQLNRRGPQARQCSPAHFGGPVAPLGIAGLTAGLAPVEVATALGQPAAGQEGERIGTAGATAGHAADPQQNRSIQLAAAAVATQRPASLRQHTGEHQRHHSGMGGIEDRQQTNAQPSRHLLIQPQAAAAAQAGPGKRDRRGVGHRRHPCSRHLRRRLRQRGRGRAPRC